MKIHVYLKFIILLFFIGCSEEKPNALEPNIIPKPIFQKIEDGFFLLDEKTSIVANIEFLKIADFLENSLKEFHDIKLSSKKDGKKIVFTVDETIKNEEGYELEINKNLIEISAKTSKGAFYAVQSLLQLTPAKTNSKKIAIQCLNIKDEPKFVYRGMHLDVSRHFFSVDFIKKYIHLMSMLKMNTFHWHLTDDQGWRIEIKKYPKLQEIAAFRNETLIGHYADEPQKFDEKKYGGFYTQEEIKEIVMYASERQITIIPEIEMPGHSQAAIAAYPELGCSKKQIDVATKWGVFEDIYCANEKTFEFLENIIDEVISLFPGKYIHIGGDEAPKIRWENCVHCQKLIKEKGLKNAHELQSYFITRMEKYINSKNKLIIGWDEILEGGLAPNATVMSWRGNQGAIDAAKQKHRVILTPNSHCYFDYYQSENENEPIAIGGFLPSEKVYDFNPIPDELSKEEAKFVLGAQGNIWTEYLTTPEKVEYMAFPRMIALSEVVWSASENKNFTDFVNRLEHFNKRLDVLKVNYANHLYEVSGQLVTKNGKLSYQLQTTTNKKIVYSLDEKNQTFEYKKPISIEKSTSIKAFVVDENEKKLGAIFTQKINLHKAVGQKITLNIEPNNAYNAGGKQALINGISGNNKRYGDKEWLGFSGEDVEITIDFDNPTEINSISTRFHNGNGQWIYAPKNVTLQFNLKNDRVVFSTKKLLKSDSLLVNFSFNFFEVNPNKEKITSIKLIIPNYGIITEGKQGAGNKAWTFIDEIIVN
jgi:hexosaminidase